MKLRCLVLGFFGYNTNKLDGQTVKTRDIFKLIKLQYPNDTIKFYDTQDFKFNKWSIFRMLWLVCSCKNVIYLPANNNLKYIFPIIFVLSTIFRFKIHYFVVGGWLCNYIRDMPMHRWMLKRIKGIHVETNRLKNDLESQYGFKNVDIFPNFRFFDFTPNPSSAKELRLVFMARIMREKGLDWIFELAEYISNKSLSQEISITFFGQIDETDRNYFFSEVNKYDFVSYKGVLQPNEIHQTLNQYDVMLLPTHFYTEGLPGSIVDAYISGIPVIVTDWLNAREFVDDEKSGFIIPFENGQDELINRVRLLNGDREKLTDMKRFALNKRKEFTPPPDYFSDNLRIVFVSRVMKDKGLDVIKLICEKKRQCKLDRLFNIDFYGEIIDEYYEKNLKNEPNMKYCGVLDSTHIISTLQNYDALIFPSHYEGEGCPGILIEGMAAGIPIIASDWKYNSEFVIDGENGFLCQPFKADDYISAIIKLHKEPATRKRMSLNAKIKSKEYSHQNAMSLMQTILN